MIDEELLVRGLGAAAERYPLPDDAVDEIVRRVPPERARRRLPRPTPGVWMVAAAVVVLGLVIGAIAAGGSGSGGGNKTDLASAPARPTSNGTVRDLQSSSAGSASGVGGAAGTSGALAPGLAPGSRSVAQTPILVPSQPSTGDSAKVVKTGDVDLQVGKGQVVVTIQRLTGLANLYRGYVADSQTNEGSDPSGSATLRVPAASFAKAVDDVRALPGVKVLSQQIAGVDVTSKYVDLQARLSALEATRTTFERILSRATTIGDTLAVQNRITDVQTQIEQLQGQIRLLNDQADFGTLTVTVDEKAAAVPAAHHQSGMSKALHRSVDRFVRGIEAIVGIIGPVLLVLLVIAVFVVAGRLGYRRLRRRLV